MITIGVSQRVERVDTYEETRDCLDHRWAQLLEELDFAAVQIPNSLNDVVGWLENIRPAGVILSGGNDITTIVNSESGSLARDATEHNIIDWARYKKIPILGVCRGMQMVNSYFGGGLVNVDGHARSEHYITRIEESSLPDYDKPVNSFHNYGIRLSTLASTLVPLYVSKDRLIEGLCHRTEQIYGTMWHPERSKGLNRNLDLLLIRTIFSARRGQPS